MAVRIQLRRDTAANWVSANPTLRAGEIGIETDTLKFKVGNGSSTWTQITSYANITPTSLTSSLSDYILAADQGTAGGPAELDSNGDLIIPENSIILWNDAAHDYTSTITATEPTADRTITLPNASGTVALTSDLSSYAALSGATFTGNINVPTAITFEGATADSYETTIQVTDPTADRTITIPNATGTLALTTDIPSLSIAQVNTGGTATETYNNITTLQFDEDSGFDVTNPSSGVAKVAMNSTFKYWEVDGVQKLTATGLDTVNFVSGTGIDITADGLADPQSISIAVDTTAIQARVADVSDTEIGYLNGVTSGIQTQIDNKLSLSGGTMTGALTLSGAPTQASHAATKAYVDNTTAGLNFHAPAHAATTANLTATYDNGTSGVGATLTGSGTFPQIDGHTVAEQERVLVKNQSTGSQNGIYVLTDDGDPSGSWVLTRATDADNSPAGEIAYGDFCFVQNGGQAGYGFIVNTTGTITIGTTSISYIQFNAGQVVIAGTGLQEATPGTISIDTSVTADISTAQTFTNKTLTSPKINEDVALTATATELNILDGATLSTTELNYVDGVTSAIQTQLNAKAPSADPTFTGTLVLPSTVNGPSISTSVNLLFPTQGGHITLGGSQTTGNLTLGGGSNRTTGVIGIGTGATSSGTKTINVGTGSTGGTTAITIGSADGATSNITLNGTTTATTLNLTNALGPTYGGTGLTSYASGDILYASNTNTLAKLAKGTDGQILTLASGVPSWAAAPITLPTQTDNAGKYLTTDGSTASWATLVVPIETGTATVTANTATTVDTTALSAFTSIEYMVSLKQGSKVRTSKVIVQNDGTSVDMTEFAITETGGTIAGVVVSAAVDSTNGVLKVTATDATSTNVTVKFSKVKL